MGIGGRAKTARQRVQKLERKRTAFELRIQGWTMLQIAENLGISRERVRQLIEEGLADGVDPAKVEQVRALRLAELETQKKRLNETIEKWTPSSHGGSDKAAKVVDAAENTLIRVGARQDAITGIEAPTKAIVASGDVSGATPAEARQVMRELFAGDVGPTESVALGDEDESPPGEGSAPS